VLTLQDLGGLGEINVVAAKRYVQSMERDEGGFHGAAWDTAHDVEYTFYGIGCLGLFQTTHDP
jgi:geranylgeranyl transferase type-2 subunit beta